MLIEHHNVNIAASSTTSRAAVLGGGTVVGIIFPAAMTGTSVTFQGSADGQNYFPLYNISGIELSASVVAGAWVAFEPSDLASVNNIKIVSGSTEAASRDIQLVCRSMQ